MINSSDLSEKITAETLPIELKTMIADQAHSDGVSAMAAALMLAPLEHYAGEFASKAFDDKYKVPIEVGSTALELLSIWLAYDFAKNQKQDWLTQNYVQQYDLSDSLLSSTKGLSGNDKKDITLKTLSTSAVAGASGYVVSKLYGLFEGLMTDENNALASSLIPEGAKPWIASAAFGTVAFLVANEIFSQNRKQEINDIRTDISFVKRLHEEKSDVSNAMTI